MPDVAERIMRTVVALGDRVVPKGRSVALRTGPDFDDQGRALVAAVTAATDAPVTWLTDGAPPPPTTPPVGCRCASARSLAGLWAFWRARVVVHTHGVYGSARMSSRKRFVNIWHGMPIKRLQPDSDVGRHQTDVTIATAPVHARHLAETWGLADDQVVVTGLPRNDLLVDPPAAEPPELGRLRASRALVVWLPTFRRGDAGELDGVDTGSPTQFAGATPEAVGAMARRLGVTVVVKPHPLAPTPESALHEGCEVWSDADLADAGLTLYRLLAAADVVVSDYSSVWVDFLLTQRPLVFAISDLDAYRSSRGFYFSDLDELLPGPVVSDLDGLEVALAEAVDGGGPWAQRRRAALQRHHTYAGGSAERVASLVVDALTDASAG